MQTSKGSGTKAVSVTGIPTMEVLFSSVGASATTWPAEIVRPTESVPGAARVNVPEPILTRLPVPLKRPEYVVLALSPPTVRVTAWPESFCKARSSLPSKPPNVTAVCEPKLSVCAPPVSSVLSASAEALSNVSEPACTVVVPP